MKTYNIWLSFILYFGVHPSVKSNGQLL